MSYTVLARKYRSRILDEIVGQEPIVTTLKNAIASGRVHHGYLFSGTRGVGKTSTARVLAKSLNCLKIESPSVRPCLECDACRAIAEGEDIDVIEIDAASNTGVDNIRELRSNASYRPARCRYKIYIVDEVHMLSTGAFNALLKTLEEPPEHVKFILATTELQKVPATIQSRVQRFEFQSIPSQTIAQQLDMILDAEGIKAEDCVLRRIANCANGSMRDALSFLDQLLSLGTDRLGAQVIDEVLPTTHDEQLAELIELFAKGDAAGALVTTDQYLSRGQTLGRFCENLIEHLRTLMLLNVCGPESELVDVPAGVKDRVTSLSQSFDAQTFVYMITVLEELRRQIRSSGAGRALTDAAVVRLACAHNFTSVSTLLEQMNSADTGTVKKKVVEPADRLADPSRAAAASTSRRQTANEKSTGQPPLPQKGEDSAPNTADQRVAGFNRVRVSSREMKAVRADPLVQQALNLFEGTLVNVERISPQKPEVIDESEKTVGES